MAEKKIKLGKDSSGTGLFSCEKKMQFQKQSKFI